MTLDEFLDKLAEAGGKWRVENDCIKDEFGRCPIQAVHNSPHTKGAWTAGEQIGLPSNVVSEIVGAADAFPIGKYDETLRASLLKAVKLGEAP